MAKKPLAFQFDSLEEVHGEIQDASPDVNVAAVEAHEAETVAAAAAQSDESNVDSFGNVFDPTVHATNKDGDPSVTSIGRFRKKKGASKVRLTSEAMDAQKEKLEARATGQLAADLLIHSAIMLGGPEWNPKGTKDGTMTAVEFNEHENLRRAFADYFEAKNISDFPPGIALSFAISGYMMPRFIGGEETKSRLSKAKQWIVDKWNRMRRGKKDATQSDTGDNGTRQNDASKADVRADVQPEATRNPRT